MSVIKKPYVEISEVFNRFNDLYGEKDSSYQKERYASAFSNFKQRFGYDCAYVSSSSGRVEVCGNHTDHNGGKVLSCAVSLDTLAFFMPTDSGLITVKSEGYKEFVVNTANIVNTGVSDSASLVSGVCKGFLDKGLKVGGFHAYVTSNVIGGAGISSSASFEVLIAEILNFLYNDGKVDCQTKAVVSQFAEREFFGKPCGLLDQTAIAFGGLKKLDFSKEDIAVEDCNLSANDFKFVLINTGGSHADLTDEYASIPFEMYSVAQCFGKKRLIEVSENTFYDNVKSLHSKVSDRAVLRAMHFYDENLRVDKAVESLKNNDLKTFFQCINSSGNSSLVKLQNCYVGGSDNQPIVKAVSLVKTVLTDGAVRIHGGGFAGCILCVVKSNDLDRFIKDVGKYYDADCILPLSIRSVGTIVL